MRKILTSFILSLLVASVGICQTPQVFAYQSIARDTAGEILSGEDISVRISILQDSIMGSIVYTESHDLTTGEFGLVTLTIGEGAVSMGEFSSIDWASTSHFVKLEIDDLSGGGYFEMGTSQLCSVPYSLQASALTLTDENGNRYKITVDTEGNLVAVPLDPE